MQNEISITGLEIRTLQEMGWPLWLFAIVAFVGVFAMLRRAASRPQNIETTFRKTFSLTDDEMMEAIIRHYMGKHACDRQDAMRQLLREVDPELVRP
ncbi:hypothetical protein J5N58_08995 [Rhizobium cremeum]|uniref:hypothetical protein n=1 Tax=Rhizobium cremeum TaxID=2813827 RepID=UPI000DD7943C|nr:hypothetical protein [Rhizobium cremeum]MCJ7994310.1 hypothetical protein [Rhizobium cremeum]MCJ7999809.1 hypothetical protein [Rhizobium cremeum]